MPKRMWSTTETPMAVSARGQQDSGIFPARRPSSSTNLLWARSTGVAVTVKALPVPAAGDPWHTEHSELCSQSESVLPPQEGHTRRGPEQELGKTPRGLGSGSIALADSVGVRNRRLGRIVSGSEIAPRARSACQSVSSELQNAFNVRILNASKHSGPQPEKFLPLEDASFPTSSQCPQTQLPGDSGEGETVVTVCKDLRLRRDTRDLSLWLWPVFLALVTLRHS